MDKIYYLLLTGVIIFSIVSFNYSAEASATLDRICDPNSPVCVFCPLFTSSQNHYGINLHTYVISKG